MTEINPPVARGSVPGDNVPDFAKQEAARLAIDYSPLESDVEKLLADAQTQVPTTVDDDEQLGVVTKFVVDIRDLTARIEKMRVVEKEPHLRRGNAVQAFFADKMERLAKASRVIASRGDAYNQRKLAEERRRREEEARETARVVREAEDKRRAEEHAARDAEVAAARARKPENVEQHRAAADQHAASAAGAAEEAKIAHAAAQDAAAAAAAKPADLVRTRTAGGHTSTMRQVPHVEIVDASKLNKDLLWPFLKEEHILMALRSYGKVTNHRKQMDGAIIEMRDATEYR